MHVPTSTVEYKEFLGIDPELLTLAYEPEAAAIYCKELTVQKKEGAEGSNLQSFEAGQQFLVLDCGGRYMYILSDAQTVFWHIMQTYRRIHEIRPMHPRDTTYTSKRYDHYIQEIRPMDTTKTDSPLNKSGNQE
jgi:hypothetical protein